MNATGSISLDGEWAARMCDRGVGEVQGWETGGFEAQLSAIVPGHLQRDLVREGLEPDFNHGEGARAFASREGKDWWLSREFTIADPSERMELCFGGVDTGADAWLNGVHLGHHENAHRSWTVDVTGALRQGENRLVVRLDDGSRSTEGRELDRYLGICDEPVDGLSPRMWVRKPQYVWGWDWAPHLLTCGIWRSVELRRYDAVALRDVHMQTRFAEGGTATVEAVCEIECFGDVAGGTVELTLAGAAGSHVAVAPIDGRAGTQRIPVSVEIADPELWWPAPLGRPALYDCRVVVSTSSGSDEAHFRYGLRTIELDRRDLGEEGESFTIVVNGVPVFCKGSAWQPPELLFGCLDEDRLRRLIAFASAANMNMLRVWGGGTYESDRFYELCDEHGILVWQDFPFACAYYPDDDEHFCEEVRVEAECAIRRLRNHASLALWCGNNENQWLHAVAGDPENKFGLTAAPRLYGERLYDEILPAACSRLDPSRPYLPGTPWGGEDSPNSLAAGCRHAWEYQFERSPEDRIFLGDIELDTSKFVSEFGILGTSELPSLERFIPEDQLELGSPSWKFHDNVFDEGVTDLTIERYWSPAGTVDLAGYLAAGQLLQAEGLAGAVRHWRRRMFKTSGAISWSYADPWGSTTSWSLIDYYDRPRAAYFHLKRAFEPLHVSLQWQGDAFMVWVVNDFPAAQEATLELGFVDLVDSQRLSRTTRLSAAANSAETVLRLELPPQARLSPERFVAYAHLRVGEEVVSRACATLVGFHYNRLRLPPPRLTAVRDGDAIELRADSYIFQLHLSAIPSDSWFDLLPGETRTVELSPSEGREISCWALATDGDQPRRTLVAGLE